MTTSDLDDDVENQHDQISYFSLADLLNDSYVYIKRALVNQFDNFNKSDVFSELLVLIFFKYQNFSIWILDFKGLILNLKKSVFISLRLK